VVYNDRAIPRYVSIDNVAALEHKLASDGEQRLGSRVAIED